MDSKDKHVKPARPVLFEPSGPPGNTHGTPRIAPAPDAGPAGTQSNHRRGFAFRPAMFVLALALAGVATWAAWPEGGNGLDRQALPVASDAAVDPGMPAEASTAVLVADVDDPMSIILAKAASGLDPAQPPDLASATEEALPGVTDTATAPTAASAGGSRASSRQSRSRATRQARARDPDLLQTLLANIRAQPDHPDAGKDAPQTLDELIARLNTSGGDAVPVASNDTLDQGSAKLQTRLRACPAANTLAGINCRQKLCAKHRGDPACPMQ